MRSSIRFALLAALIATGVRSTISMKITGHMQGKAKTQFSNASTTSVGSTYFITNEPTGNYVVTADIGSNGKLTMRAAYATGGIGLHSIASATGSNRGPDGLVSQGAVTVNAASSMLAAVNPGSHSVSLFKINETDPADLKLIGEPISSGGHWPTSVAFNSAGDMVCVLNGGAINGVRHVLRISICFHVNQTSGLQVISDSTRYLPLNQSTPALVPGSTVSQVIFSEDDQHLVVSVKGNQPGPPALVGYIAVWEVLVNGSLSESYTTISPPRNGNNPFGITTIKGKNAIIAADTSDGFDIFDLTDGSRSSSVTVNEVIGAICWSAYSPRTENYYMIDAGGAVFEVNVNDKLQGSVVQQYNSTNLIGLFDGEIASLETNDFLYILAENLSTIEVMSLDAPGTAQQIQSFDVAGPLRDAGIAISSSNQGMAAYVKNGSN